MNNDGKLNYVEFPAQDLTATKAFFSAAFDWSFVDYGPDYVAFSDQGLDGGFSDLNNAPQVQQVELYWCFTVRISTPL